MRILTLSRVLPQSILPQISLPKIPLLSAIAGSVPALMPGGFSKALSTLGHLSSYSFSGWMGPLLHTYLTPAVAVVSVVASGVSMTPVRTPLRMPVNHAVPTQEVIRDIPALKTSSPVGADFLESALPLNVTEITSLAQSKPMALPTSSSTKSMTQETPALQMESQAESITHLSSLTTGMSAQRSVATNISESQFFAPNEVFVFDKPKTPSQEMAESLANHIIAIHGNINWKENGFHQGLKPSPCKGYCLKTSSKNERINDILKAFPSIGIKSGGGVFVQAEAFDHLVDTLIKTNVMKEEDVDQLFLKPPSAGFRADDGNFDLKMNGILDEVLEKSPYTLRSRRGLDTLFFKKINGVSTLITSFGGLNAAKHELLVSVMEKARLLIKNPDSVTRLLDGVNNDLDKERLQVVFKPMVKRGIISPQDIELALEGSLY